MLLLTDIEARQVYRKAVECVADNRVDESWWQNVVVEVRAVVAAPSELDAARLIDWWHNDWSMVGDTPLRAAKRIRTAARRILHMGEHPRPR